MNNAVNFLGLPNILKETKNAQQQISLNLNQVTIELEKTRKVLHNEQESLKKLVMEKSQLERSLCALDVLIPNLQTSAEEIEVKNKDLGFKIDHATWNQSKAELIAKSENRTCEKKELFIKQHVLVKNNSDLAKRDKEEEEKKEKQRKEELIMEKANLTNELNRIVTETKQIKELVQAFEQENKVLLKRNSALLLRLQRLLKETVNRKNQISLMLKTTKQEKMSGQ